MQEPYVTRQEMIDRLDAIKETFVTGNIATHTAIVDMTEQLRRQNGRIGKLELRDAVAEALGKKEAADEHMHAVPRRWFVGALIAVAGVGAATALGIANIIHGG